MQIEAGKYYRTRDGRKAGPAKLHSETYGFWDLGQEYEVCHEADGTYLDGGNNPSDLIAEWVEDGPVRTETVTKRRIVPGVYGPVRVEVQASSEFPVRLAFVGKLSGNDIKGRGLTADELDALADTARQLAEALRDDVD